MYDLPAEFIAAEGNLIEGNRGRILGLGVSWSTLFSGASVAGAQRIQTHKDRTWSPSPNGVPALIVPVGKRGPKDIIWEEIYDLIALFPDEPDRWFLRANVGTVLGEEQFEYARIHKEPLFLVNSPLGWLKAGTHAACVLDWRAINAPFWFRGHRVFCDTLRLAKRLERALKPAEANVSVKVWEQAHAA